MNGSFAQLVEDVKQLSADEKQELHDLLKRYLIEERRQEIAENYQAGVREFEEGKLTFTTDIDALRKMLTND